jgi:hypothetical protein
MDLKTFVENFDSQEKIRIEHKGELVYEGNVEKLSKLLNYKVIPRSGKIADGVTQVSIRDY